MLCKRKAVCKPSTDVSVVSEKVGIWIFFAMSWFMSRNTWNLRRNEIEKSLMLNRSKCFLLRAGCMTCFYRQCIVSSNVSGTETHMIVPILKVKQKMDHNKLDVQAKNWTIIWSNAVPECRSQINRRRAQKHSDNFLFMASPVENIGSLAISTQQWGTLWGIVYIEVFFDFAYAHVSTCKW